MRIILVNIKHTLNAQKSNLQQATERAWKLNLARANSCDAIVGVAHNKIESYYMLDQAVVDSSEPHRLFFHLRECSSLQRSQIIAAIGNSGKRGFTTKYLD